VPFKSQPIIVVIVAKVLLVALGTGVEISFNDGKYMVFCYSARILFFYLWKSWEYKEIAAAALKLTLQT
jgi:hypothetical protein